MDTMTVILALLPVILIEFASLIFALVDLLKNPNPNGPKWLWGIVIVVFQIIGPILYFVIGRRNY
ncbi:PLD nuclease N-terminal domain-containing protein [Planococcus lenghuensis]|uniref:Negative regulator of sigma-Y activity n=1 Tax=Planococcus lenghuensis TaxID=2213202 RepID=A0A1Q2L201_9BACL|nr:PLD nuclease N-terminal domain-containing protein [Planococcus lenghuensis]AQQ54451.1 negative regulator of sigma-Y activity [Planococcus lenghuensis]